MDITTIVMMNLLKWTAFACSYSDGAKVNTEFKDRNERSIKELPSIFNYFSYMFFFPSALAGIKYFFKI